MKTLTVTIHAELEVPDDWHLADHPSGMQVLKIGDRYVDFEIAPLATRSMDPDAEWSDADIDVVDRVLDRVTAVDVDLKIEDTH